jgi:hypothetical protein
MGFVFSPDSMIGTVTTLLDGQPSNCGLIPGMSKKLFSSENVQNGSEAHLASC